jgi:hypothetical protein
MEYSDHCNTSKNKGVGARLRFNVLKRDGFACKYCGARPPNVVLHVDHVIPSSKGGGDNIENLVAACNECNIGKGSTLINDDQDVLKILAPAKKRESHSKGTTSPAIIKAMELVSAGMSLRKSAAAAGVSLRGLTYAIERQRSQA